MSQNRRRNKSEQKTPSQVRWLPLLLAVVGFLVVGAAVYTLLGKSSTTQETTGGTPPNLQVDKELIDLGDVKFNQLARVSFQVSNTGEGPLQLTKEPYIEVVEGC